MSSDEAFGHGLEKSGAPRDEGGDGQSVGPGAPTLRIFALGRARVEKDGLPLDSPDWIQKSRELLYYLLSFPQGRTKEQIGLALWPEASTSQLRSSFHDTLYRLRRALGQGVDCLNPKADLKPGATYIATVTANARDLAGNQLDQDPNTAGNQPKFWSFKVRR